MNEELIYSLRQNREQLKKIDGNYNQNDYTMNNDIENEFLLKLESIDLKEIKNKS